MKLKLGRPNRAEQFFVECLENAAHGPGYFEEVEVGVASLPPLGSAHGSHLVAACEQVVRSDFWHHRIFVCTGLPSKLRASRVRFSSLRARDGVIVSGTSDPHRLEVLLHHTGDPVEMEVILAIPCEVGLWPGVTKDGEAVEFDIEEETIKVRLPLEHDMRTELVIEG